MNVAIPCRIERLTETLMRLLVHVNDYGVRNGNLSTEGKQPVMAGVDERHANLELVQAPTQRGDSDRQEPRAPTHAIEKCFHAGKVFPGTRSVITIRSEEHTSELQSRLH